MSIAGPTSIHLVTLAPGHFHAALVQKRRLPGIDPYCTVYGPDDADLKKHLERIAGFGLDWDVDVRAGADWLERFERERAGNVVVLSGRNRPKLDLMRRAVGACMSSRTSRGLSCLRTTNGLNRCSWKPSAAASWSGMR